MKKKLLAATLMLSCGLAPLGTVHAGTANATLDVTALVGLACNVTTTPVDFGIVDPAGGAQATGQITITCTPGAFYTIALDAGKHAIGFDRNLADTNGNLMAYQLINPLNGLPWGDNTNWPAWSAIAMASTTIYTVQGSIPVYAVPLPAGYYSDTVNVTVTY